VSPEGVSPLDRLVALGMKDQWAGRSEARVVSYVQRPVARMDRSRYPQAD